MEKPQPSWLREMRETRAPRHARSERFCESRPTLQKRTGTPEGDGGAPGADPFRTRGAAGEGNQSRGHETASWKVERRGGPEAPALPDRPTTSAVTPCSFEARVIQICGRFERL